MRKPVTDREVYPASWISLFAAVLGYLIWRFALGSPSFSECWFYGNFHIYCPGCGGTRAVIALMHGRFLQSAYYHPAVPFVAASALVYLVSQTIWRLRGRRGLVLHYSSRWPNYVLAIFLLNCVVRNLLWFGFHIPL